MTDKELLYSFLNVVYEITHYSMKNVHNQLIDAFFARDGTLVPFSASSLYLDPERQCKLTEIKSVTKFNLTQPS